MPLMPINSVTDKRHSSLNSQYVQQHAITSRHKEKEPD